MFYMDHACICRKFVVRKRFVVGDDSYIALLRIHAAGISFGKWSFVDDVFFNATSTNTCIFSHISNRNGSPVKPYEYDDPPDDRNEMIWPARGCSMQPRYWAQDPP